MQQPNIARAHQGSFWECSSTHTAHLASPRPPVYEHIISEYHTHLANISFDKLFDITAAGVYLYFYNMGRTYVRTCVLHIIRYLFVECMPI